MCRLAAYWGAEIPIEDVIVKPEHSLIEQSLEASEAKFSVNGDGFGVAWYGRLEEPGLFKHTLPAWSDLNLLSLARHVAARIILGHVRAATSGATMHTNCHPFVCGRWSFAHNGQIGGFQLVRRQLEELLSDELYLKRLGTTDSELIFLLMLQAGLDHEPAAAIMTTIATIEQAMEMVDIKAPLRLSAVLSDGKRLFAIRHASDGHPPTLYYSNDSYENGLIISSERMNPETCSWRMLKPSDLMEISAEGFITQHGLKDFQEGSELFAGLGHELTATNGIRGVKSTK